MDARSRVRTALVAVLLVTGCSERPTVRENRGQAGPGDRIVVRVVYRLAGDDIGSPEHQAILKDITTEIVSSGAGDLVRTGYGMGSLEIVVAAASDAAAEEIKRIVATRFPRASCRIERSPR